MKFLLSSLLLLFIAGCCPYSFFTGKRPAAEPNVDKLCAPILAKEAPGLRLEGELKVEGDWAFFLGDTVNASGERIDPPEGFSSDSVVLFRKLDGQWLVVEHGIGITDAYYLGWYETHDIPEGLLTP